MEKIPQGKTADRCRRRVHRMDTDLGGKAVPADKLVYGKFLNTTINVSQVVLNPNQTTPATSVW